MAKRIAQHFTESLLSRIDIINVIDARVPLKKAGRDYQACCPFHSEKTPSFTVSQKKQFYYCFGCGAKGNAVGFLMDYEHLSFVDTIEKLAEDNGITVEYEQYNEAKAQKRKDLYDLLSETTAFYENHLYNEVGQAARHYLDGRQVDKETATFFRLGFSPVGNHLQSHFSVDFSVEDLQKAGLLTQGERGLYEQFRERLMFPIRDPRGRVLGFGARALGDIKPKYLNSRETEVFLKRYVLYGLYETLQSTRNIEYLIVVEGYMDVIALHQKGVHGAVATLGTAFTPEHLSLVKKHTNKMFICFDGDNAGKKAAQRAMQTILPVMDMAMEIRILFLPDGEDPDTLVRNIGQKSFITLLGEGLLFSEFVFQSLISDSNLNFVEGRGEVASRAKILFDELPNTEYKSLLYQKLTEKIGMDIYQLAQAGRLPSVVTSDHHRRVAKKYDKKLSNHGYKSTAESRLIRLLMTFPDWADYVDHVDLLALGEAQDSQLLWCLVSFFQTSTGGNSEKYQGVFDVFDVKTRQRLKTIMTDEHLVDKVNVTETIEEKTQRLKTEFIGGLTVLLNRLQRKIR
ncbi:MAG: DNA primase [Ostreibacterium sp.]